MGKQDNQSSDAGVQVFELTMDNPENQDELNRRLQKPMESDNSLRATVGRKVQAGEERRSGVAP